MATTYTETPNNFCEIEAFVETEIKGMKSISLLKKYFFMMHVRFKDIPLSSLK